ncbi:MAG: asparagine synthase (glutamine-hydrolyzing), partial [Planctomycetota bacterium]
MCGIAGYFAVNNQRSEDEMASIAGEMADTMVHRGPDSSGVWADAEVGLALAHRRLSVIDLSTCGNQPMHSENNQYLIVFNGEIYNYRQLRRELLSCGRVFRGTSDTEVILSGCEKWGVEETIRRCVGMFAIALWDVRNRQLYLIRDRMGEKPLYFGWQKDTFLFSSELKAMRRHPDFHGEIDRDSLSLYFRHNYVPAPYSIYRGVHKLEPGTILKLPVSEAVRKGYAGDYEKYEYWSLRKIMDDPQFQQYGGSPAEAVSALEALLIKSVEGQMIADVPLGAFLSGGIDSSTIVALMQKLNSQPVRTFCIGFEEDGYDEAVYSRQIAKHLGCRHTELYVTSRQAKDVIPGLSQLYDEPFADPSQIPTFLVSKLATEHVTVSLSGDAGDELFCGYNSYSLLARRWNVARRINITNRLAKNAILRLAQVGLNADQKQLAVAASLLSSGTYVDAYRAMRSICHDPCRLVPGSHEPAGVFSDRQLLPDASGKENAVMALDTLSYLPDDILVKVDRAAMACSLETRIPMLDHRIVEFAFRLPFDIKFREGVGKWPLRQILYKYVPRSLVERPKKGFAIPLDRWLRDGLREWACDSLNISTIKGDGILDADVVHGYLDEHMNGRHNHKRIIWGLLMFQS